MKVDRRELAAAVLPGALFVLLVAATLGAVALTLDGTERAALGAMLAPRAAVLLFAVLLPAFALGVLGRHAYRHFVAAPARLAEQAQVAVAGHAERPLEPQGSAGTRALALAFNDVVQQRAALRGEMAQKVRDASRDIEQERSRLAALMSELRQAVVVCNLDGRILLYNQRARLQFRALSSAPAPAGGAELIGLGRSVYAVLDRHLVAHALESVQQRLQRGVPSPTAQFVTHTRGGRLLRVQMAPVRAIGESDGAPAGEATVPLSGFVLMLDNITRDFAEESQRDQLLHDLTESSRASLGNLQAAIEMLDYEDLDAATRERFLGVIRDEVRAMGERIRQLAGHTVQAQRTRWPLEDMLGADLCAAAVQRIESVLGCRASAGEVDPQLWLKVDSFSLLQALVHLAGRLVEEHEVKLVRLRLASAGRRAQLDLVWAGHAMSTETVIGWETEPMHAGEQTSALTVRDVVARHDGAFWFERERVRHEAFFRFLLPLAADVEHLEAAQLVHSDSRPEYYDFDLFRRSGAACALDERLLTELSYTVFDTETTGLDPSGGDEIIQIGATRIVAGKLRRQESFEQLVDPKRPIPEASIPIHGISPDMVAGQPTIKEVLPAFHAYAHDTVLVAHNAAFDMRFLQLKEAATGVVFDQPVLDTLLLSAVLHPQQERHGLEDIAERFGVVVLGRHTGLGDAMVTAEIFLKMLPLLEAMGIRTLRQAREASQKTYYARLKY